MLAKWGNKVTEARETILRRVAAMLLASEEAMGAECSNAEAGPLPVVWNPQQMDVSYDQFARIHHAHHGRPGDGPAMACSGSWKSSTRSRSWCRT